VAQSGIQTSEVIYILIYIKTELSLKSGTWPEVATTPENICQQCEEMD